MERRGGKREERGKKKSKNNHEGTSGRDVRIGEVERMTRGGQEPTGNEICGDPKKKSKKKKKRRKK